MNNKKQNTFLSQHIYKNIIPENNFWARASEIIDWSAWAHKLAPLYSNTKGGNSNWSPVIMLKVLLLQRVYNTSDRKTEELCTQNIFVKYFLGIDIDKAGPDFSTISKMRNLILSSLGPQFYESLFEDILISLKKAGLSFGGTYMVDSTISDADVNIHKDNERQNDGEQPRDQDAKWTAKSRPAPFGEYRKTFYFGYKSHTAVSLDTSLIAAVVPTPANVHDSSMSAHLVRKVQKFNEVKAITADKGYEDATQIAVWEEQGIRTAIGIKRGRINTKNELNNIFWKEYIRKGSNLYHRRSEGERAFADQKRNNGLNRARYLGLEKYKMQSYLSALAYNLKRGMKILFGQKLGLT